MCVYKGQDVGCKIIIMIIGKINPQLSSGVLETRLRCTAIYGIINAYKSVNAANQASDH